MNMERLNSHGFVLLENNRWLKYRDNLIQMMLNDFEGKISRLEDLHSVLRKDEVNDFRLRQMIKINNDQETINTYLEPFWDDLKPILGPDCLRQKRINLVIHMPGDESSIIPTHSDVKTGNSSFEIGLWLPLTECLEGNTMTILPYEHFCRGEWDQSVPVLTDGKDSLLFKHFLPHGNQVNNTNQTRISLNIRFKSLFAPENKKNILDYYTTWKISEFSKIALAHWIN
ncbi:MAG: hypothetical protein CME63_10620 [Halobacteriovoraceae bacterium]|nr:hypothetical protein [Halobacteriovoraceae bacterium]|tara:strand:+ start:89489 stop:90172 length:684 start_codon:yes stop_codon:yes gene_type:complete